MSSNRREFIEHLGATAMLGALPLTAVSPLLREFATPSAPTQGTWDFGWTAKLKGKKHKACLDCAEVESGYGVWRASFWETQYQQALGAKPADLATVLVLRHNAIVLAFQQSLWDAASIGSNDKVTHPVTLQGTDRNPALLSSSRNEIPATFDAFALPNFISRGGIVLACNLALEFFASGYAQRANLSVDEAKRRSVAALIPGVTLMPSGVLACLKAQDEGCNYLKAS
ncbi:MAG TPA: hypothetical protein VEB19_11530 [Gemmatimonadaceae bacterium]|nr:hypothetical protein [Gemmatimonadaceae bacterium]